MVLPIFHIRGWLFCHSTCARLLCPPFLFNRPSEPFYMHVLFINSHKSVKVRKEDVKSMLTVWETWFFPLVYRLSGEGQRLAFTLDCVCVRACVHVWVTQPKADPCASSLFCVTIRRSLRVNTSLNPNKKPLFTPQIITAACVNQSDKYV